jgi:glycosyltransferase involved in cell wall biosynthesis
MSFKKIKKIVFCPVPLPPPYYGSNMATKDILESRVLNETFNLEIIPISYNKDTSRVGKLEITKFFLIVKNFITILIKSFRKYNLVYFVPAVTGLAFIRDLLLILPLKISKQNIIIHLHGKGIKSQAEKSKIYKSLYKFFFKNTSVICLSERLVYDIKDVFDGTVYIVNNGVKPEIYPEQKSKNEIPVILFLSNFIETKGILVLLEAAHLLKSQNLDFRLNLVGAPRGDIMDKINHLIEKYDLQDQILSLGPKYDNEKKEAFQNADIFVLPTYNEAWGLVNLEAMQASLPVISTDEGAIPDIIDDGITGFIVKKQDAFDLAEKIALLLKDENLRIEMGKKGKEKFLNNYTYEIIEKRIVEVFKKATE